MIAGRSEVIANARCGFGLIREGSAQLSWRQLRFTSPCSWRPRCVERRATNGRTRERKQQYLRGSCSPCFWVSPAPAFTSGAPRLGGSTQRATRRTTCLPISPFQKMGRPLLVVLLASWATRSTCSWRPTRRGETRSRGPSGVRPAYTAGVKVDRTVSEGGGTRLSRAWGEGRAKAVNWEGMPLRQY